MDISFKKNTKDFSLVQALRSVGGGLVSSLLSLAYCFSYSALMFSGPLEPLLPQGVAAALITAAVTSIIVAFGSSFRSAIAGPDSNTAAPLAAMMAALAPAILALPPSGALALCLASLMVTTLFTGGTLFLLGWQRLGKLIRFIPYPVVAGFLAATGWLMFSGAIKMTTGVSLSLQTLPEFANLRMFEVLGATALWAYALWFLTTRWKKPLVLPLALVSGSVATHFVLAIFSTDLQVNADLMFSLPSGLRPVMPLFTADFFRIDWSALAPAAGDMIAVCVLAVLTILMNSTSIELATECEVDLDRELRVQGLANIASAAAGGFVGYVSVSRTLVNIEAGGVTRLSGVVVGLVALAVLFVGGEVLSYVPRFILGGLLLYLGAQLIWEWAILSRKILPLVDWLIVVAIVLLAYSIGFLQALVFGVLAGCVIFAVDVSRIRIIRHEFGLNERTSSFVRSQEESAFLLKHGGQVHVLELSGYVFFGSAYSMLERTQTLLAEPSLKVMIFDFSRVTGIDSSAGALFGKIRDLIANNGARQIMVAMSPRAAEIFDSAGAFGGNIERYDHLDAALEAEEEEMLKAYDSPISVRSMIDWLTDVAGSPALAQVLFDHMRPAPRDANSYFCHQGDPTDGLFFIERGPVSVILERADHPGLRVRKFGRHTLAGEVGFFLNTPRSASLLATHEAVVWFLSRAEFDRFMTTHPEAALAVASYVIRQQAERLIFANQQIESMQN